MKKVKFILILTAAALMSLGVAACGGGSTSSVNTSDVSSITKSKSLDYIKVNTEVDLDEYLVVKHADGSTDQVYDLACSDSTLTINGHKITASEIKTYSVTVKSGTKTIKLSIPSKSANQIKIIDFLAPLEENIYNATFTVYGVDESSNVVYGGETAFHTENYGAIYNEEDPGEVDSNGDATSFIIATLSDGKSYTGYFNADDKVTFKPGAVSSDSLHNYYLMWDLSTIDGSLFESSNDAEGNEILTASASFTEPLLAYGISLPVDRLSTPGTYSTTELAGFGDSNNDGTDDTILFAPSFVISGKTYTYLIGISNIGTTKLASLETAVKDSSYVPVPYTATEMKTSIAALNTAANYTVTVDVYASNSNGVAVTIPSDATSSTIGMLYAFPGNMRFVNTVTSDGAQSVMSLVGADSAGKETLTTIKHTAYFNREGAGYLASAVSEQDKDTGAYGDMPAMTTKAITDVTDVFASTNAKYLGVASVTDEAIGEIDWTDKATKDGTVTWVGSVGDDDKTTKTNTLFGQLFNSIQYYTYDDAGTLFGSMMIEPVAFNAGDYHAMTIYSEYSSFAVNTTTNAIDISVLAYMPNGSTNGYFVIHYVISAIGTTVNDFSSYVAA